MNKKYTGFLGVLAYKKRILIFDDNTVILQTQPDVLEAFELYNSYAANNLAEEHLSSILTTWKPDAVIIESNNPEEVIRLCTHISQADWKIAIIVIVPDSSNILAYRAANAIADTMLCRPCTNEAVVQKIVTALAAKQSMIQLSLSLDLENLLNDSSDLETLKVTFEGNILLLCESLHNLSIRLKDGELSPALFNEIADAMDAIAQIFAHSHYTHHVSRIFKNLGDYLRHFNFDSIDISTLEGFDYLINIVDDITLYVKNFFVNRLFSDVYIFEHSLENSIVFMKNRLENREDTLSDLEFF